MNSYFDKEKKDKALNWLDEKMPDLKCECCDHVGWVLGDLVMTTPYLGGNLKLGGATIPQFMIVCENCGNTKHINAVISGVVGPDSEVSNEQ